MNQLLNISNVILAFSEPPFSSAIKQLICRWSGISKITFARNLHELKHNLQNQPNVLLIIDQLFPELESSSHLKNFISQYNQVRTILFYYPSHKIHLQPLRGSSISAFISRTEDLQVISHAVREVIAGRKYISASLIQNDFTTTASPAVFPHANIHFSPREIELICLLHKGFKSNAIIQIMDIKPFTYNDYRSSISAKVKAAGFLSTDDFLKSIPPENKTI